MFFFFSSRRRHTRLTCDWSSDVCSSDLTVATAISIGNPASYDRAVTAIRETDGVVTAVSDAEILEAKAVVDASGAGCEPASAASVAGARQLIQKGVIRPD